jgi:hypothetical protein
VPDEQEGQMNWDIIASTGEWAGAIAVIASLLDLARQIKALNQQSRSAARYSFLEAYSNAHLAKEGSTQVASVFRRGLDDSGLSEDEQMQFSFQLGQFLNTWSVMFDLHEEGELPANQWYLVRSDIYAFYITPGGKRFWEELGRLNTHQSFVDYVDDLLESGLPSWNWPTNQTDT